MGTLYILDLLHDLNCFEIDNRHRLFVFRRSEQAFVLQINCEMVEVSGDCCWREIVSTSLSRESSRGLLSCSAAANT